jgi:hypothetical protein
MNTHCEVRFHLSKGEHYKHWQVKVYKDGSRVDVQYYDPKDYQLELKNCKLINKIGAAKRVNESGVKSVSGWVECEDFFVTEKCPTETLEKIFYNPIKDLHWRREGDCGEFEWDNSQYQTLVTEGKQVFILEER